MADSEALAAAPGPQSMDVSPSMRQDLEAQAKFTYNPNDKCCYCYDCGSEPREGYCGLPPESRPDLVWVKEDLNGLYVPAFFATLCLVTTTLWWIDPVRFDLFNPGDVQTNMMTSVIIAAVLVFIYYPLGTLVWYKGMSVAMTRKVTHTIMMTVIPLGSTLSPDFKSLAHDIAEAVTWSAFGTCCVLCFVWMIPMRRKFHWLRISFSSIERSEDRPNALLFLLLQSTAMSCVQTPMIQWMLAENKAGLIWIPFMAVGLGDGLAEPIGRMYGKHKYEVYAIGTSQKFTRSYEGSFTVFFFTFISVLIAWPAMRNWLDATLCLLLIPAANTYAEAKSPHTFDNHIMWGVTWALLWFIFDVVPQPV